PVRCKLQNPDAAGWLLVVGHSERGADRVGLCGPEADPDYGRAIGMGRFGNGWKCQDGVANVETVSGWGYWRRCALGGSLRAPDQDCSLMAFSSKRSTSKAQRRENC